MAKILTQEDKVCRTNLIQNGKDAEKKDWVFRGLIKSKLDAHLGVILIWYNKTLVWISDHLEKVSRSNLIEFSDSRINMSPKIIRHLLYPQPSFAKVCMWLVITSYYTPLLWLTSKAGKTFEKILVRNYKECLIFPVNAWWEYRWNDTPPSQNRSWKITHKQEVLKIDMGWYLSNIYFTKYCQVIKEQYVEYFYIDIWS